MLGHGVSREREKAEMIFWSLAKSPKGSNALVWWVCLSFLRPNGLISYGVLTVEFVLVVYVGQTCFLNSFRDNYSHKYRQIIIRLQPQDGESFLYVMRFSLSRNSSFMNMCHCFLQNMKYIFFDLFLLDPFYGYFFF